MMNTIVAFRHQKKNQSGLAIVEFTVMLPMLLLLFLGTAEIGRLLYDYNTLTKAQRNGVRHLAIHAETGNTDIYVNGFYGTEATNLVVYGNTTGTGNPLLNGLTTTDVTVDDPTQDEVRVTVSYDYTPMVFTSIPGFGLVDDIPLTMTLSSSVTMRAMRGG
ncbi:pilus assembly protein [Pontibacterium sp. N1Y112]|uniref:Pilus assembly protein n=1 Tax=Pontibacterium sinense TaxID=2781979 RepID=A0A8J7FEY1_9GAMM|nr:TadE/TadG family type IV pilus assembly protein [Pontibacterium sinense]MBE9398149.1 pilus assembly protein [Pontibacterium sinense]